MLVETVGRFFAARGIQPCRVIVACSGGADSTALLLAFAQLRQSGFDVVCAHVNHHLRGAESEGDEQFVRDLCAKLEIALEVADGTLDEAAIRRGGIEAAARHVRHERLQAIRLRHDAPYIATAHQKNDQAETVIMRIVTGTSLAGLRAIHPVRADGVIRPLLEVTRQDVESFLREGGVTPRVDSSNADPRFLRNRVRAMLKDLGEAAIENIASVAGQVQQVWPLVEASLDEAEKRLIRTSPAETRFMSWPDDPWMRQAILQRQIRRLDPESRDVSARDLERLAAGVESIRRVSVTKSLELVERRGRLVLRRVPESTAEFEFEIRPGAEVMIPETGATIRLVRATPRSAEERSGPRAHAHRQLFQLPPGTSEQFTIRNRRRGDRFQPLGLPSDKKLKDFLIDRKIALETRDSIPLLLCHGEIVWVGGVEISERFKVTSLPGELYEVILEHGSHQGSHDDIQR